MPRPVTRRDFLGAASTAAIASVAAAPLATHARAQAWNPRRGRSNPPVAIASSNGLEAVATAVAKMRTGDDPLDAAVEGVAINEADPEDMTVGYGGLPNENGVVTLDSCVMHGPSHRAGAVAHLENILHPAAVAREVARRTDHVLLVDRGALDFARKLGFEETNLLTEEARKLWLRWKSRLNDEDDWLDEQQFDLPANMEQDLRSRGLDIDWIEGVPHTTGTIHLSAVNADNDLAGVTTTSGLSWKLPGRVGDSPIIGAGNYCDNEVGSAGATGRGEAVIQTCGAHTVVTRMEAGDHPTDACLHALRKIADRTKAPRLLNERGEPNFNVIFYAVRKDGAYGSACMREGRQFAVADADDARREDCAFLFPSRD
jgi:N4-(beta-N-acetylglucosaminyl)-L-asparaginase